MSRKAAGIDLAKALGRQSAAREVSTTPIGRAGDAPVVVPVTANGQRAPSRAGQTNISGWFDMPVKLKMDELRVARQRELGRRVTQQELLSEAFNDLFKKYGLPEMAPSGADR